MIGIYPRVYCCNLVPGVLHHLLVIAGTVSTTVRVHYDGSFTFCFNVYDWSPKKGVFCRHIRE